jgi:FKBP-type peptidyl-prolyl cis-trans isomerase SlyD
VDFNSPLAGKTLIFDVTLKDILSEPKEKLIAVLKRRLPGVPEEKCNVSIAKKSITFEIPFETRYVENINYAEIGLAMDALKVIPDAKDVKLVTKFERPLKKPLIRNHQTGALSLVLLLISH